MIKKQIYNQKTSIKTKFNYLIINNISNKEM